MFLLILVLGVKKQNPFKLGIQISLNFFTFHSVNIRSILIMHEGSGNIIFIWISIVQIFYSSKFSPEILNFCFPTSFHLTLVNEAA